ncbi:ribosyldihydronicotinamide dehydrogenase [quinone] isoform X3 [Pongo abelii]|uniref:ribosyldihydronicotinamide dehydrogenase [quinone] isoform X3 n=1 Tax=Pongo abelii TaxID=9601 RepID=UPI0023E786D3|nr:ribosyldihydronicotinamide dehydrogenase [quinone] isoform X3 [Pongo abelii]
MDALSRGVKMKHFIQTTCLRAVTLGIRIRCSPSLQKHWQCLQSFRFILVSVAGVRIGTSLRFEWMNVTSPTFSGAVMCLKHSKGAWPRWSPLLSTHLPSCSILQTPALCLCSWTAGDKEESGFVGVSLSLPEGSQNFRDGQEEIAGLAEERLRMKAPATHQIREKESTFLRYGRDVPCCEKEFSDISPICF